MPSRSSDWRPSSAGIASACVGTGVGNPAPLEVDCKSMRMSAENPLSGAPRTHGELLKLGFEVAQSSVVKYMVKQCGPPSQGSCTFVTTHRTSPPWTCSLFRPLASICSMSLSSSGWPAETLSGSTSQPIRPRAAQKSVAPPRTQDDHRLATGRRFKL